MAYFIAFNICSQIHKGSLNYAKLDRFIASLCIIREISHQTSLP